jgi:transposase InsO family protein
MENLQDSKIKEIVSDGCGEFVNFKFKNFTKSNGINHIVSPPKTPEHNGYAERANRTVLDKARALLLTSKLPNTFWAEAINTTTFVSNLLVTPLRSNFSPYELWTKTKPPLHRLRNFGSKAYVAFPKKHRSWKLGKTSEVEILVGFENEATVY